MTQNVTVKYAPASDTLYVDACPPYKEQESDAIGMGVLARTNPHSGAVETIGVMSFQKRLQAGGTLERPISLDLRATETA